jgi:hypothetical protein
MACSRCGVAIEGQFPPARLGNLPSEHQRFIEMFILASGNLKVIAKETAVSYPTVRSRLNKVIDSLRAEISLTVPSTGTILDALAEVDGVGSRKRTVAVADPAAAGKLIKSI